MLDTKELLREFNEAFGVEEEEYSENHSEDIPSTEEDKTDFAVFNEEQEIREEADNKECLDHFLSSKFNGRDETDECRYFYRIKKLKEFVKSFVELGGDLSELRCGRIRGDSNEIYSYEVCRIRYFDGTSPWFQSRREDVVEWKELM